MSKGTWQTVYRAGQRGYVVNVRQRAGSTTLYLQWWNQQTQERSYRSLGHTDLAAAKREADRLAVDFLNEIDEGAPALVSMIFARYEEKRTPHKSPAQQKADRRRMDMWQAFLDDAPAESIDRAILDRFVEERRAGLIPGFKPVRGRQVEIDVKWLSAVLRWAASVNGPNGQRLITGNPIQGYTNKRMGERNPRRPLASWEGFLRVYRHADRVDTQRLLKSLLLLSESLGWRVSALCQLRAVDLDLASKPRSPFGRIKKREETDKEGVDAWVPLPEAAQRAARRLLRQRGAVGKVYLFPSVRDPQKPWTKDHAQKLHKRAQYEAGLGHRLEHGSHGTCVRCGDVIDARGKGWFRLYSTCAEAPYLGYHAYRRKWVTERKKLPRKDVAAAGGWRSVKTLDLYEQVDEDTMFEVVSAPAKLRELPRERGVK